jgi:hypothetical protein
MDGVRDQYFFEYLPQEVQPIYNGERNHWAGIADNAAFHDAISSNSASNSRRSQKTLEELNRRQFKRNVTRGIPAREAACPDDNRPVSKSFTAKAMRASSSKDSELIFRTAGMDSGYSIDNVFIHLSSLASGSPCYP